MDSRLRAAEGKKVFLMGGGIGVPPILELAKQMKCDKKQIVVGYRDAQTFLKEEFEQNGEVIHFHREMEVSEQREMLWTQSVKMDWKRI